MAKVRFMSASFVSYLLNILLLCSCYAFRLSPNTISATRSGYRDLLSLHMNRNELGGNIVTKSLFALTEAFGSIGRLLISTDKDAAAIDVIPEDKMIVTTAQFDEIAQNILDEYKAIFWATGNMDTSLWTDNCTFADPFSSFGGKGSTARFKANADNLGKFVVDPSIRITSFEANQAEYTVIVGWTFRSKLRLPWKPTLAASGRTTHYLEKETGLIYRYEERWSSKPLDIVKRLFVPS